MTVSDCTDRLAAAGTWDSKVREPNGESGAWLFITMECPCPSVSDSYNWGLDVSGLEPF